MNSHRQTLCVLLSTALCSLSVLAQSDLPKADADSAARSQPPMPPARAGGLPGLFNRLDADHDGALSSEEINGAVERLRKLDRDADGKVSRDELGEALRQRLGRGPGQNPGPARLREERDPREDRPAERGPRPRMNSVDRPGDDSGRGPEHAVAGGGAQAGDRRERRDSADATRGPGLRHRVGRGPGPGPENDDRPGTEAPRHPARERGPADQVATPPRQSERDTDRADFAPRQERGPQPRGLQSGEPRGPRGPGWRADRGERERGADLGFCPHCGHRLPPPAPASDRAPEHRARRGA